MSSPLQTIHDQARAARDAVRGRANWIAATLVAAGFIWRLWLAHATFFNTDEAWHYSLANQDSLSHAYKASLTIPHPPLLVLVLYFWRSLGTSNLALRLPCVIAGTMFCWVFWKWLTELARATAGWAGLVLVTFLPPMIAISADLRQYPMMLLFSVSAAYFLERALAENAASWMALSAVCLCLAMLSNYSAFFFAAAFGAYCILRMRTRSPSLRVIFAWGVGQAASLGLAWFLYRTHIAKIGSLRVSWLYDYYLHAGRSQFLPFLYHGTFGVFRFVFGQITIGGLATLMFATGTLLLLFEKPESETRFPARLAGIFLLLPFILSCAAVTAGLYPYGRTRQCVFLAIFAIAGVAVFLARVAKQKIGLAVALTIVIVVACHAFGTLQGRDMLPLADQRHEHMDQAMEFIQRQVSPSDLIFVDAATRLQLGHYLCRQEPISIDRSVAGLESFQCRGFHVISTGPNDGVLTADTFKNRWQEMASFYSVKPETNIWVFQGGWASGLGEALRAQSPEFSRLQPYSFGRYLEIFKLKVEPSPGGAGQGSD
ncbi:MAG TPA: glycosyltransferase family 39 protein [Candidatus Acidoferrum sp.]|nr:glycosyltransferase family 39 protein [Candidatus Acidoferrum sp.]